VDFCGEYSDQLKRIGSYCANVLSSSVFVRNHGLNDSHLKAWIMFKDKHELICKDNSLINPNWKIS